jgi:FixJ family two-component response regulator
MGQRDSAPCVFLVDDDASVRRALTRGLAASGFAVRSWDSASAFLADHDPHAPGCLVADVAMPGLDGLALQQHLSRSGCARPVVFITGVGDVPTSVRAMRAGAVHFLPKPVHLDELVAAITEALERDAAARCRLAEQAAVESRLTALTSREREVLDLVVAGKMNKQIAAELGAAEKTIKVHRGRVMRKMQVRSVAELVTLTARVTRG